MKKRNTSFKADVSRMTCEASAKTEDSFEGIVRAIKRSGIAGEEFPYGLPDATRPGNGWTKEQLATFMEIGHSAIWLREMFDLVLHNYDRMKTGDGIVPGDDLTSPECVLAIAAQYLLCKRAVQRLYSVN